MLLEPQGPGATVLCTGEPMSLPDSSRTLVTVKRLPAYGCPSSTSSIETSTSEPWVFHTAFVGVVGWRK